MMNYYNHYPMMDGYCGGWDIYGIFMMLFWVAAFIAIIIFGARWMKRHDSGTNSRVDPIDIIKERYAKGEISQEEFEKLKKDLK